MHVACYHVRLRPRSPRVTQWVRSEGTPNLRVYATRFPTYEAAEAALTFTKKISADSVTTTISADPFPAAEASSEITDPGPGNYSDPRQEP